MYKNRKTEILTSNVHLKKRNVKKYISKNQI